MLFFRRLFGIRGNKLCCESMKLILNRMPEILPKARKFHMEAMLQCWATPYTPPDPDMASNLDIRSIESGINPNCFIPAQIDNLGVKKSMEEEHYPPG